MKNLILGLVFFFLGMSSSWALIEFSGEFGYDKQVYGTERNNKITSRTYGGSMALYLFNYTAVELNYGQTETTTTETDTITLDNTYDILGQQNKVLLYNYGIGIRQAFASRKARVRPSFSIGYARQFVSDSTEITFKNKTSGATILLQDPEEKYRSDSVFGTLSLDLRLTKSLSLRGSVKTIFKAFEFDQARDNMKYLVGFTWYL